MKKDSTKILWRVQVRKSRAHKWRNYATYETRSVARVTSVYLRGLHADAKAADYANPGYGFGNTRVVRVERGGK